MLYHEAKQNGASLFTTADRCQLHSDVYNVFCERMIITRLAISRWINAQCTFLQREEIQGKSHFFHEYPPTVQK